MKLIDKFLNFLHTDRNTFATYILTLITIYLAIDRIVEMLLMIFTGVSYSYWGPIEYTLALACPIFAYLFSGPSKFSTSKAKKVTLFYLYVIGLYIIAISMFTQWLNMGAWLLLLSVPNYTEIITEFSDLVTPAFRCISLYLPLVTIFPLFKQLYLGVNDTTSQIRSIWDYAGISLADKNKGHGPYTCDVYLCSDGETGKKIIFGENARYKSLLVCGGSGTGKTSLVYEPLIAKDIEKKYFFREVAKEMGFTALKTNLAYINAPYNNDYINRYFHLSMLSPVSGKEALYKAYFKKLILSTSSDDQLIYKDLGLTVMSPDYELIEHMISVCDHFDIPYKIIDPSDPNKSIGLNPFTYKDSSKIAITISSALKSMYVHSRDNAEDAFGEEITIQAIENLTVLLKEVYPRMNNGMLPNMKDLLKLLTNFNLIEKMCEILAHNPELKEKYEIQINYFKKNFYANAPGKSIIEKYIPQISSQLDNLLRISGVDKILCNRRNNLDFDKALQRGEIVFVCTRRGDLGPSANKAFGLFFLMSMQNAVLRRPGNENNRIPNFLYIDEFADYICKSTEAIFTMYRKYKIGTAISIQSLSQLDTPELKQSYRSVILSNCANKIFTGNGEYNELEWWSKELCQHREWTMLNTYDHSTGEYDPKHGNVNWQFVVNLAPGKLQNLASKDCAYKVLKDNGKPGAGVGNFAYLSPKYKEDIKFKLYDFGKYSDGVTTATEDDNDVKKKFDYKNITFKDDNNEFNPVQTNTTDSNYLFDNENAIVVNLKKRRKN